MQSLFLNNNMMDVEIDDDDTLLLDSVKEIRASPAESNNRYSAKSGRPAVAPVRGEWGGDSASSGSDGANSYQTDQKVKYFPDGTASLEPPFRSCFFEDVPSPSSGTTKTSLVELPPGLDIQDRPNQIDVHKSLQQRMQRQLQQQHQQQHQQQQLQQQQLQQQQKERDQQRLQQQLLEQHLSKICSQVSSSTNFKEHFRGNTPQDLLRFQSRNSPESFDWSSPSTATSQQDLTVAQEASHELADPYRAKLEYRIQEQRHLQNLWKNSNTGGQTQTDFNGSQQHDRDYSMPPMYPNQMEVRQQQSDYRPQHQQQGKHFKQDKLADGSANAQDEYMRLSLRALASRARGRGERLASVGAALHAPGRCTPCLFWFRGECGKGYNCTYCHMVHEGQTAKKVRLSKRNRELLRQSQLEAEEAAGESIDEV